jgi:ATP-dependent Clp protease ATP-binding subunit ClpA
VLQETTVRFDMPDNLLKRKRHQQMEHFTNRSRLILQEAQNFAESVNHAIIHLEHILMGLIRLEDSNTRHVLLSLNLKEAELEQQIKPLYPASPSANTSPQLSEDVKQVLVLAVTNARKMVNHSIEPEHLLIGLMKLNNPQITQILKTYNTDAQTIIAATESLMKKQLDKKDKL